MSATTKKAQRLKQRIVESKLALQREKLFLVKRGERVLSPEHLGEIDCNAGPLEKAIIDLTSKVSNLPLEVRDILLRLLDSPAKLCRVESCVTSGTRAVLTLKPSDLLLDLLRALRTGDFDNFIVKHSHN